MKSKWVIGVGVLLVLSAGAAGEIVISGVSDETVYADRVTFTVSSEEGYDYTALLNGEPVAIDEAIEVNEPEYYQLYIHRSSQSSGAEESVLVQFIVRASDRGTSEVGLPRWTPYPMIDSAAGEFAGGVLEIVTPGQYPIGLEIPVIARVENASGKRLGVNGNVTAAGFEDYPVQLLRGVGSVFLPSATEAGIISYTGEIATLENPKLISIEETTTWQTVAGNITTSTDWGEDARVHINAAEVLMIASGGTLTIGAGSVIVIDADVEIAVEGSIVVNGTNQRPVVFTSQDRTIPWGGFLFESASANGEFTGTILTASGADPDWFDNNPDHGHSHRGEQCLFYLSNGADVTLTDCYIVDNHGQAGHGESSYLTMTGCLVQKCITTGQYNSGAVILEDCALIEFPSATAGFADDDNDGFYLTGGAHSLTDCLVGWALDDGVDAGSGDAGSVVVTNCWFESCYHEGMAWSESRNADVAGSVAINCGQGLECGFGSPDVDAVGCLSTANVIGARFGDNYDWSYNGFLTVSDSLLLFNVRDVWGRAWDNWEVHLSQMDIQGNYLSIANDNFVNNSMWDPIGEPNQIELLEPFLPTTGTTVGIGFAVDSDSFELTELSEEIAVRLSSFTTNSVSVDYTIDTNEGLYDGGTLEFVPGESVKFIQFEIPPLDDLFLVRITLSSPVNAELTGYAQVSFARPLEIVEPLVLMGDQWRYFKGTEEPPVDWNELLFDDDGWLLGETGIGYETGSGYESCIATNLTDMKDNYISVYARREFVIDDAARLSGLILTMDWDDGYIAYINGVRVDSQFAPDPVAYDKAATTSNHEACCGTASPTGPCPPVEVDLSEYIGLLDDGVNVLAVQAHNTSEGSSDFIFIPQLYAVIGPLPGDFEPDGDVDFEDLAILAAAWLTADGQAGYNPVCDISVPPDDSINIEDLLIFAENWLAGF